MWGRKGMEGNRVKWKAYKEYKGEKGELWWAVKNEANEKGKEYEDRWMERTRE
jgi:hypothetical protein